MELTIAHPFYVQGKGWVLAKNLIKDDKLVSKNRIINIEKVERKTLENNIKVYNFEVEDWHTYFVGQNSVLVHNRCSEIVKGAKQTGEVVLPKVKSYEQAQNKAFDII